MNCNLPDEFEVANSNLAELHGNGTHAPQKANKKPAPHSVPTLGASHLSRSVPATFREKTYRFSGWTLDS